MNHGTQNPHRDSFSCLKESHLKKKANIGLKKRLSSRRLLLPCFTDSSDSDLRSKFCKLLNARGWDSKHHHVSLNTLSP